MTEPMDNLVAITGGQFVALDLACPRCGAPIALLGRLELTPDRREGGPFCVCESCGAAAYLALRPGGGLSGAASAPP